MYIIQQSLFDFEKFIVTVKEEERLVIVLEGLDTEKLLATLERERWTGRKGYSVRGMWAGLIAGVVYQCPTLAGVVRLLKGNRGVREVCGFAKDKIPSEDAMGRFLCKLASHERELEECFEGLVERLRQLIPGCGKKLVADSTDIIAWSNGHRRKPSDTDAKWGTKNASHHIIKVAGDKKEGKKQDLYRWFGYKLHLLTDALSELPVSFVLTPANAADTVELPPLLEKAKLKRPEAKPEVVITDKGYDSKNNNELIYKEYKAIPIIPIREREGAQQTDICNAKGTPTCGSGLEMVYWGRDGNYLKYRCPRVLGKGVCKYLSPCTASAYGYVYKLPIADDVRRHPPVPRETRKWARLYKLRTSIERVNGRLKDYLGLRRITVRGIVKVTVRTLLSLLVMVATAIGMAQRDRLKEVRTLVGWSVRPL
ncbi:MAG: transposase [Dehalococcoidales bacterium]|nr:transposase [Dehalococcoidales bacterium]